MSYEQAFAAVPGCEVLWCKYYGSYSGDLLAKIKYKDEILYIRDYFGSCSGCDSFESAFGWKDPTKKQLASFGLSYVEAAVSKKTLIGLLKKEYRSEEAQSMLKDLREDKEKVD